MLFSLFTISAFLASGVFAASCECKDQSIVIEKQCFCDGEAAKLKECLKNVNPNWPFAEKPKASDCGDPVTNKDFSKCLKDSMPKVDPKSNQEAKDCIQSRGLKASSILNGSSDDVLSSILNRSPEDSEKDTALMDAFLSGLANLTGNATSDIIPSLTNITTEITSSIAPAANKPNAGFRQSAVSLVSWTFALYLLV